MYVVYYMVAFALVILISSICVGIYFWLKRDQENSQNKLLSVVDSVNATNLYTYNYERQQNSNLRNLDRNVRILEDRVANMNSNIAYMAAFKVDTVELENAQKMRNHFDDLQIQGFNITARSNIEWNIPSNVYLDFTNSQDSSYGLSTQNLLVSGDAKMRGELSFERPLYTEQLVNQPLIESRPSPYTRYGVGHFTPGITRLYSANKIALGRTNGMNGYVDMLEADSQSVTMNVPLCFSNSVCLVANGNGLKLCPADNTHPSNPNCRSLTLS